MTEELSETGATAGQDTVVYTRYADGRISLNPVTVEFDANNAAEFLAKWLKRAGALKDQAAAISLASKEFTDATRFEAVMTAVYLRTPWIENWPEKLFIGIMLVKVALAYIGRYRLERSLVKDVIAGKEIILFTRFREMPNWSWIDRTMIVSVGTTAYPLASGYSFNGKDETGRFTVSQDIEGKLAEWACPPISQWPWELQKMLDDVSEDDLLKIIFPLASMKKIADELASHNAKFKVMAIYESRIGRQAHEIGEEALAQLGIIKSLEKAF